MAITYTQEQLDIALLKQKNEDIYKTLDRFDKTLDRFDASCATNFTRIDKTIEKLDKKINWVITAIIVSIIIPIILHHYHLT